MKLPNRINEISLDTSINTGCYPLDGFLTFYEGECGGDCFGLYWEYGKEHIQEPIVCQMYHDEGKLIPAFSNLDKFLEWWEISDYGWEDVEIEDKNFINYFLKKGDECLKQNKLKQAVEYYIKSVNSCSEISEVWCKLASLYKRMDNELAYQQAVINSILSNWSFGFPSQNAIRMLKSLRPFEKIKNHPLIIHRNNLDFKFGGTKENPNYHTMKKIIDELSEIDKHKSLLMEHNYALMMYWETTAFQERYNFDYSKWKEDFKVKTIRVV